MEPGKNLLQGKLPHESYGHSLGQCTTHWGYNHPIALADAVDFMVRQQLCCQTCADGSIDNCQNPDANQIILPYKN